MNSQLTKGVAYKAQSVPCRKANDAETGPFAGLIGVNSYSLA